jgi:DNA-damage-inducible protein J
MVKGEEPRMKTQNEVRVTVRVDKDLKERAESLFGHLGMNMTTALNVFLRKAVDESAIPFAISAKMTGFGAGLSPAEVSGAFKTAVQKELAENQRQGFPTARYDAAKKQAYLESADGTREYIL